MIGAVKDFLLKIFVGGEKVDPMKGLSPAKQWDGFLARFTPDMVTLVKGALVRMRRRVPGAVELVYDNYNALVLGFGPNERASAAIFSLAIHPKWANLFFLQGARLKDPQKLLKGGGNVVRHIRLSEPGLIDDPGVRDLMDRALAQAALPIDSTARRRMIIKAVAARQRPRRP